MDEPRLAEDVVAELADELGCGLLTLGGRPGCGASVAAAHLAAALADDERLVFLDEPSIAELRGLEHRLVVAAHYGPLDELARIELTLAPWGFDEIVEYLLASHCDACASVIARLGRDARLRWSPRLAAIVLERFAVNSAASDVDDELCARCRQLLPEDAQRCGTALLFVAGGAGTSSGGQSARTPDWGPRGSASHLATCRARLLVHDTVHRLMAADGLVDALDAGAVDEFAAQLPRHLVELVGRRCRLRSARLRRCERCSRLAARLASKRPMRRRPACCLPRTPVGAPAAARRVALARCGFSTGRLAGNRFERRDLVACAFRWRQSRAAPGWQTSPPIL